MKTYNSKVTEWQSELVQIASKQTRFKNWWKKGKVHKEGKIYISEHIGVSNGTASRPSGENW